MKPKKASGNLPNGRRPKRSRRLRVCAGKRFIDLDDGDCETRLEQLDQDYAESHESDPPEIFDGLKKMGAILLGTYHIFYLLNFIAAIGRETEQRNSILGEDPVLHAIALCLAGTFLVVVEAIYFDC